MSFSYLSLPLYLLMIIIVSCGLAFYSIKVWNKEPKMLLVGLFILGLSTLGGGLNRLSEELQFFGDSVSLIKSLTVWVGFIGTIFIIIGAFQKVKNDPHRKKLIIVILGIVLLIYLFIALLIKYSLSHP